MSTVVKQRFIHMTARKLRLVADTVRGKSVEKALAQLHIMPKIAAQPVAHAIKSAYTSAKQSNPNKSFVISEIYIDEGPAIKRRILKSRGRATRMEHRMSHITVIVTPETESASQIKKGDSRQKESK